MYIVGMIRDNFKISKTILYAPLAGISDSSSRKIAISFGADMTISELISSEGIIRGGKRTLELAGFDDTERPIGLQLFGADPGTMARAAKMLSALNPDFIDLNFGCPARKVIGKNGGSAILKNLGLFEDIVKNVVDAVAIPVTVKMRSGWDMQSLVYLEAGRISQENGVAAVTLHPRTRTQGFSGEADWTQIAELKNHLDIPVIGNGDIRDVTDAKRMFDRTGCDGIMLGRASIGNPWIFNRIKDYLKTGKVPPEPSIAERVALALEHFDMTLADYGIPQGVYRMRSRFAWYLKGFPGASTVRAKINRLEEVGEIKDLLTDYAETILKNESPLESPNVSKYYV